LVAVITCAAVLVLALGGVGLALSGRGALQRAADLAAICGAQSMREDYPGLFAPAVLESGDRNPAHLERGEYTARAERAAASCARANGAQEEPDVRFGEGFAPVQVTVALQGERRVRVVADEEPDTIELKAKATAEMAPDSGTTPAPGGAGGYTGPLETRQGKPMRPDVAQAFDRMAAAAKADGISLIVNSGFRSDAEQAALFAANPDPKWVARPGESLHRLGTELDLGPPGAEGWLAANAERFGFVQRYSWEPWHFGYTRDPGSTSVGYGSPDGRRSGAVPSFVPAQYRAPILRASQRWNVSAALLSAQLYAESNFNPFSESAAGARGIAQFMPGTASAYGLDDPLDPAASIDAQGHLMRDLLERFASVPLALAAYNAGQGAVAGCGCIPDYPETQGYVARILGLLGGAGEQTPPAFSVRLVR
jgi:hypothetical protein